MKLSHEADRSQGVLPVVLITGADPPTDLAYTPASDVLPKHRLNPTSLTRLWQDHAEPEKLT
jgi:hypothetical protein